MIDGLRTEGRFKYVEQGEGHTVVLLHGLFGALSNFVDTVRHFCKRYKVVIPVLPLYELKADSNILDRLVEYVEDFIEQKKLKNVTLIGNSLGGHVALMYALKRSDRVNAIVLTGSSGLYENSLGDTYPKKSDYDFVKTKTEYTFYDPKTATKELIDEVFEIVNNRNKALNIIYLAKSAIGHNMRSELSKLRMPVKLIWGKQDTITPDFVGEEFHRLLPDADLVFIDKCGHAPMMERPTEFNEHVDRFLTRVYKQQAAV